MVRKYKETLNRRKGMICSPLFFTIFIIVILILSIPANQNRKLSHVTRLLFSEKYDEALAELDNIKGSKAKTLKKQIYIYKLLNNECYIEAYNEFQEKFGKVEISVYGYADRLEDILNEDKVYCESPKLFECEKEGYNFRGYEVEYYTVREEELKITLRPIFEAIKYHIIYDLDGGEISQENPSEFTVADIFVEINKPKKRGYRFDKWIDQDGNDYYNGFWVSEVNKDLNLKAQYEQASYYINFITNGGYSIKSLKIKMDEEFNLPIPEKMGYTFIGWYLNDQLFESGKWDYEDSITLHAKWKPQVFKITLDYAYDEKTQILEAEYRGYISLPTPTREGYTFLGWYDGSKKVQIGRYLYCNDLALQAKWQKN